jgi:hypothetical protein
MKNQGNNTVNSVLKDRAPMKRFVTRMPVKKGGRTSEIRIQFFEGSIQYLARGGC